MHSRPQPWNDDDMDAFAEAHVDYAALSTWLDHCEERAGEGVTVDGYAWTDTAQSRAEARLRVTPEMRAVLDAQARRFAVEHMADLSTWFDPSHAGYDLWMSRTGQGVNFMSRYLPNDPDDTFSAYALGVRHDPHAIVEFDAAVWRLDAAADALPHADTYVGDDGRIHLVSPATPPSRARRAVAALARIARAIARRP